MHITRYTDYALRTLMYVALKGEQLSTIREIALSYDISRSHLMKVTQQLAAEGYLEAIRGKNGGIRLGRVAADINIGAVVRQTESDQALLECFAAGSRCVITPDCQLKLVFADAKEAFLAVLDAVTLEDLLPAGKRSAIAQALKIQD